MLEYPLLQALAAVVRQGSFEKAARALHVTPSAISQRVKLLEERVGKILVARGQPCTATDLGAALCRHAERVAALESDLSRALPELGLAAETPWPTVRVAANADSVATWFTKAMSRFAAEAQALLDVVVDDQDHTEQLLRTASVQAAVTTLGDPIQGCQVVHLGRMHYIATCSPDFHRRYFKRGIDKAAFAEAPCMVFNAKDELQHAYLRKLVRTRVEPPVHWLPSSHAFVEACLGGMGWGLNPEALARPHLKSGTLVEVSPGRGVDVNLYWQAWRLSSPLFESLTRHVVRAAKEALA